MYELIYRLGTWLLQKLAVGFLIAAVGLGALGLWLFVREEIGSERKREERLIELEARREMLAAEIARMDGRLEELRAEAARQKLRAEQAARLAEQLRALESWWRRWVVDREERRRQTDRLARAEADRMEAEAREAQQWRLANQLTNQQAELLGDLERTEAERQALSETGEQGVLFHLRAAWSLAGGYVILALAGYFFGPTVLKVFLYFCVAPLAGRARAIQLAENRISVPTVGVSRVSIDIGLRPGEILRVKERFLQASDEELARRTRFVLDWRIPFTSVACGLIEMIEMRNTHPVEERRVTFSNNEDPNLEMAMVDIPIGLSLILRPSFLAGVIIAEEEPLRIERHWIFHRLQSWVTLHFRYFEFHGPCRLLVVGSRGVRGEIMTLRESGETHARRANQEATIGFTPDLSCRPVRAETFWSYYRNMNPLFDDLFRGEGLFLMQETASADRVGSASGFWSRLWNGVLKVFGL